MKTFSGLLGALASTLLVAGAAAAADTNSVQPAEFGRDGVPRVTPGSRVASDAVHVQAFGRDVPATRKAVRPATPFAAREPAGLFPERFGRS